MILQLSFKGIYPWYQKRWISHNTVETRPDKVAIHDVFTPTMSIGVVNVSDSAAFNQLLVVTTEWRRRHIAKKHNWVHANHHPQTTRNTSLRIGSCVTWECTLHLVCHQQWVCGEISQLSVFNELFLHDDMAVWHSGNALVSINKVNLRWAWLVLGWVTVSRFDSRRRHFISVCK